VLGSAYWAFTPECAAYVLDFATRETDFMRWTSSSFAVDEHFFHTIIGNSDYCAASDGFFPYEGNKTYRMASLHQVHESMRKIYTEADFDELRDTDNFLCARSCQANPTIWSSGLMPKFCTLTPCRQDLPNRPAYEHHISCFGRRGADLLQPPRKTAACLRALADQATQLAGCCILRVIVTDDGSTDGTREMLASEFPQAVVIPGGGSLFWAGGMRAAFGHALSEAMIFTCGSTTMSSFTPTACRPCSTRMMRRSGQRKEWSRGGLDVQCPRAIHLWRHGPPGKWLGTALCTDSAGDTPRPCDTMNGNCVLISHAAAAVLGNMDAAYRHGIGDMDYGLRATRARIPVWVMPDMPGAASTITASRVRTLIVRCRLLRAGRKSLHPRAWRRAPGSPIADGMPAGCGRCTGFGLMPRWYGLGSRIDGCPPTNRVPDACDRLSR